MKEHTLFDELQQAIAVKDSVDEVLTVIDEINPDVRKDLRYIKALFWCAAQAIKNPNFYRAPQGRPQFKLADPKPDFITRDEAWAWGCIRAFLKVPRRFEVSVPAAVYYSNQEEGKLVRLVLEIMENGGGQAYEHSVDVFNANGKFNESMTLGWEAALRLIPQAPQHESDVKNSDRKKENPFDGRWRIMDWYTDQPLSKVEGGSAGGAAARGWWYALSEKYPDEGVIVLAGVEPDGELTKVGGVTPKVQAIVQCPDMDTIVIATQGNLEEAKKTLQKAVVEEQISSYYCENETEGPPYILRIKRG
jgi:hypothetical protein